MVSCQGGEDDLAACNLSVMITVDTTTFSSSTEYATDVFQNEDGLVGITCNHTMDVQDMSLLEFRPMYGAMFPCLHASGNQVLVRMHASGPDKKLIRREVVYVHDTDREEFSHNVKQAHKLNKKRIQIEFLFIFLPCRKTSNPMISNMFKTLSLKDSGWGPPAGDTYARK